LESTDHSCIRGDSATPPPCLPSKKKNFFRFRFVARAPPPRRLTYHRTATRLNPNPRFFWAVCGGGGGGEDVGKAGALEHSKEPQGEDPLPASPCFFVPRRGRASHGSSFCYPCRRRRSLCSGRQPRRRCRRRPRWRSRRPRRCSRPQMEGLARRLKSAGSGMAIQIFGVFSSFVPPSIIGLFWNRMSCETFWDAWNCAES
jgi:hypothetical protein